MKLVFFCCCFFSISFAAYIQVFNNNFANLDNWVAAVEPGKNSGNNE